MEKLSWHTEQRKIDDLIPYEQNPRKLTERQLGSLGYPIKGNKFPTRKIKDKYRYVYPLDQAMRALSHEPTLITNCHHYPPVRPKLRAWDDLLN